MATRGRVIAAIAVSCLAWCALPAPAFAQPKKGAPPKAAPADKGDAKGGDKKGDGKASGEGKVKNFDFNGIDLNGHMRTPQLLYFLERANEELERASLEKRSFIPSMTKSIEDEAL